MTIRLTFEMNSPEEVEQVLNLVYPNRATVSAAVTPPLSVPIPPQAGTTGTDIPVASAAVLQLLKENGLTGSEITGTGKAGRVTKADVVAYLKTVAPPAPVEPDPFALDDEPPTSTTPPATKEQVRTALIGYQTAYRDSLIAKGTPEEEAKETAMNEARGLLGKVAAGVTTLGALTEAQYGAVVMAATAAVNAL